MKNLRHSNKPLPIYTDASSITDITRLLRNVPVCGVGRHLWLRRQGFPPLLWLSPFAEVFPGPPASDCWVWWRWWWWLPWSLSEVSSCSMIGEIGPRPWRWLCCSMAQSGWCWKFSWLASRAFVLDNDSFRPRLSSKIGTSALKLFSNSLSIR